MTNGTRRNTLILLGLVVIITATIAASLPQLDLKPGMPLPRLIDGHIVAAPVEKHELVAVSLSRFAVVFFVLALAGSFLYMLYQLFKGTNWKTIVSFIPPALFISSLVMILIILFMLLPNSGDSASTDLPLPTPAPPVREPLGPAPALLPWLVGIGLLITAALIGIWIFSSSHKQPTTLEIVGLEAEKARMALRNGLDLRAVIIGCYRQMSLVLQNEQRIERKDFMTTGEFENLLETAGVPHDPVHQLTLLFEAVRYGNWRPNPADDRKAIQSLEAIVSFSQETKRTG